MPTRTISGALAAHGRVHFPAPRSICKRRGIVRLKGIRRQLDLGLSARSRSSLRHRLYNDCSHRPTTGRVVLACNSTVTHHSISQRINKRGEGRRVIESRTCPQQPLETPLRRAARRIPMISAGSAAPGDAGIYVNRAQLAIERTCATFGAHSALVQWLCTGIDNTSIRRGARRGGPVKKSKAKL